MRVLHRRSKVRRLVLAVAFTVSAACSPGGSHDSSDGPHDPFWALLSTSGSFVESYGSVAEMAAAADLVVVGTIRSIAVGREWGERTEVEGDENVVASLLVEIDVTDVLRGTLPDPTNPSVTWEQSLAAYSAPSLAEVIRSDGVLVGEDGRITPQGSELAPLPQTRSAFFLRVRNDAGTELTPAPEGAVSIGGVSYRLVNPQGLITDDAELGPMTPLAYAYMAFDSTGHPFDKETPEGRLSEEIADFDFEALTAIARG